MATQTKHLIHKNLNELNFREVAFLLWENIVVSTCITTVLKLSEKQVVEWVLMLKDDNYQKQRKLVRELILLNNGYLDTNPNYFYRFSVLIYPP